MSSMQDKSHNANHPVNQTPPIDLNSLHTPHKLAAFVVNVPSRKAEFAFLFNEDRTTNPVATNTPQQFLTHSLNAKNIQFLNVRSTTNLKPPSMITKKHKSKSKKKHKKKLKITKPLQHIAADKPHSDHLNVDEQEMEENLYNAEIDTVGPSDIPPPIIDRKPTIENDLPTTPLSASSKTNVFNDTRHKSKSKESTTKPSADNTIDDSTTTLDPTTVSLHQVDESTSTVVSEQDEHMPMPEPGNIDMIGDIPRPMEPVMPSRFDDISALNVASTDAFKYEISMVETPTLSMDMPPSIGNMNRVSIDMPNIDQLSDGDRTPEEDEEDEKRAFFGTAGDDLDMKYDETYASSSCTETDDDEMDEEAFGTMAYLEEEEENICIRIGKVLYENSWTGDMIASSTEFSRREYNALLDVGNIPTDSYISNLVWKIIFYSQKKSKDDLINEDKEHIKWYWFDSNDMDSDWKWRKYNVIICQWITQQFEIYLKESSGNEEKSKLIDFKDCQKQLIHMQREKKSKKQKPIIEHKEEEKEDKQQQKNKKITIDAYFDKSNYDHFLLIERDGVNANILLWHKIMKSNHTGHVYYREIRMDHKLLAMKPDMIIANYQPNPSPFAIPPQLAVDT